MKKLSFSLLLSVIFITSCADKSKEKTLTDKVKTPTELMQTVSAESSSATSDMSTFGNTASGEVITTANETLTMEEQISISYIPMSKEVELILKDLPKELIKKTAFEDDNIIYNIPPNCHKIGRHSWRCCGRVIITWDGRISSVITTSSNNFFQGFTGAMMIVFNDNNGQPLFEIQSDSYGVNREQSRTVSWTQNLERWKSDLINISSSASVYGIHTPTGRTGDLFARRTLKALEYYAKANGVNIDLQ